MARILLLHGEKNWDGQVKDYLELGGYEVMEEKLEKSESIGIKIQLASAILLECSQVEPHMEVCQKLRGITDKPILILADYGEEWEKVKMFRSGADDYLVRPYLQTELMARIRAHIDCYMRLTQSFGVIKVRDMVINAFARKVYIKNELIPLRLKEFDILLYLAQHQNRVVTKEEIYRVIWKTENFLENYNNAVAVYIKRIREKIETDIENPQYVETVWGIGYRFVGVNMD